MRCTHLFVALLPLVGCAAGNDDSVGSGSASGGSGGTGGSGSGGDGGTGLIAVGGMGGGGAGGPELIAEVFGHSDKTLYRLDPETKQFSTVGNFSGCTDVTDIALDKDSALYGTTEDEGLYSIDAETAECTLISTGAYPNSLSLVPIGTLDANEEALVGYLEADYVRIDKTTGAITTINAAALGAFISSGDLVSVIDGPTYLTVKDADFGDVCADCLVRIDPATGALLENYGSLGYDQVFGVGFWAGTVFGFTNSGELFEITVEDNVISTSGLITPPGLEKFWGAGSTTSAPPEPIPK